MAVTYDYYHIFYYVAICHSFTKAAEELNNNQPNVTRCINNLEHELGCKLFTRSNKGVNLTHEGEKLFRHVSVAFNELEMGEEELISDEGLTSGTIAIGTSDLALNLILLDRLSEFKRNYPGIKLKLNNSASPHAISELLQGKTDYALITTPTQIEKPLRAKTIKSFNDILICSKNNYEMCEKIKSLRDIKNYTFICLNRYTSSYIFYKDLFTKTGAEFKVDIEAATMDQVLPMIRHNLGIGFYPRELAEPFIKSGEIFRIELEEAVPQRNVCLVENLSKPQTFAMKALKHMLLSKAEIN